jgi:hypothetical protein
MQVYAILWKRGNDTWIDEICCNTREEAETLQGIRIASGDIMESDGVTSSIFKMDLTIIP